MKYTQPFILFLIPDICIEKEIAAKAIITLIPFWHHDCVQPVYFIVGVGRKDFCCSSLSLVQGYKPFMSNNVNHLLNNVKNNTNEFSSASCSIVREKNNPKTRGKIRTEKNKSCCSDLVSRFPRKKVEVVKIMSYLQKY